MTHDEIIQGIAAMQRIQQSNPPSSGRWIRASEVLRKLVGMLNGTEITPEMWDSGQTAVTPTE